MKPRNAHECIKLSYITNRLFLVNVSATLVTVLTEVHYDGLTYRNITKDFETMHTCLIISFNNIY